jgi:type I restriction enzyme S subunit
VSTLPQGWTFAQFDDLVISISNGIAGKQNKDSIGIPVSRIETIAAERFDYSRIGYVADFDDSKLEQYRLKEGDLLFSHINSPTHLGKTAIYDGVSELYHGTNLLRVVTDTRIFDVRLLFYYCKQLRCIGFFPSIAQHAVNQSSLNQKKIKSIEVCLPPLAEQKRIADKLDHLLARVDACKARLDTIPSLLKRFRQSVLAAATSGRLTEEWREEKGLDLESWNQITIGSVVHRIEAGLNVKCEERPPEDHERGLVKISAVTWGTFDDNESKTLPVDHDVSDRTRIQVGDFLISRANTLALVGACVIVHKTSRPVHLSDKVLRLQMPEELKLWVLYNLRSASGRAQIEKLASGNQLSMRNLSQANLKSIQFLMPQGVECDEIVRRVENLFAMADRIESQYQNARARVDKLTQSLLAKAFRGELVPQDPNDEPAAVLLERIRAQRAVEAKPSKRKVAPRRSVKAASPHKPSQPAMEYASDDEVQKAIVNFMQSGREYTRAEITAPLDLSTSSWNSAIKELKSTGKVQQQGEGRGTRYLLNA